MIEKVSYAAKTLKDSHNHGRLLYCAGKMLLKEKKQKNLLAILFFPISGEI